MDHLVVKEVVAGAVTCFQDGLGGLAEACNVLVAL